MSKTNNDFDRNGDNQNGKKLSIGVIIATVFFILLFIGLIIFFTNFILKNVISGPENEKDSETENNTETVSELNTDAETLETEQISSRVSYTTKEIPADNVYKGYQILVNADHSFNFDGTSSFITLYGNKSNNYQISSSNLKASSVAIEHLNDMLDDFYNKTGKSDVLVKAAYRSYDEQKEIYDSCFERYGEDAVTYVAKPGCSDHNTGLSFDLSVYSSDGIIYSLDYDDKYSYITDNCKKYGFILRFPSNKASITGISTDLFHFRYVGVPHSYYISEQGLCLEEYIELVKQYTFNGEHLHILADGSEYEVYYCPLDKEKDIQTLPVPEGIDYSISGNNSDGFIVSFKIR